MGLSLDDVRQLSLGQVLMLNDYLGEKSRRIKTEQAKADGMAKIQQIRARGR